AHGRVINTPGIGLEHFHDQSDDALGGVVLAALLALGQCELPQEVFVDMAEDVLAVQDVRSGPAVCKCINGRGQGVLYRIRERSAEAQHPWVRSTLGDLILSCNWFGMSVVS